MRLHQMESGPAKNALKRPFEGGSTVRPFYSLDIIAQVDHQNGMWMGYCDYWDHTGGMWDHWGGGMSCYIAIPIFGHCCYDPCTRFYTTHVEKYRIQ